MTPADLMLAIIHVLPPFEATCVHRGYLKGEKSPVFCMCAYAWRQAHYLYEMLITLLKNLLILHFVITEE